MGFDDGEDEEMSSRTFVSQSRKFEVPSLPPLSPPRTGQSEASRRLGVLKNRTQSSANLIFCSPESSRLSHISSASKIARAMRYPWRSSSPPSSWSPYTTTTVFPDWITQSEEWKKMNGLMRRRDLMDAFQKPNHLRDHTQIMLISEWLKAHWSTAAHLGQRRCIALAKNVQYLTVKRDMEIITEGERGYTFYIMISGEVIIHKKGCGNISTLGSGSYFGERALNTTTGYDLRQASVISNADPCKLLVLHKSDYDTILRNYQESIRAEAFQVLKSVPLFSKWSRSRLERICAMLERKEYKPSTVSASPSCELCKAGFYGDGKETIRVSENMSCTACNAGKFSSSLGAYDISTCVNCPSGYFSSQANSSFCTECKAGSKPDSLNRACVTCDPGRFSASHGAENCTQCGAGYFQPLSNSTSCKDCIVGRFSEQGATSCLNCPSGRYNALANGANLDACIFCGEGEYQETDESTSCDLCSPGTAHSVIGSSDSSDCTDCRPGTYSAGSGNNICSTCEPGKFGPKAVAENCTDCGIGKYSTNSAATTSSTCIDCGIGTYTVATGSPSIIDCISCPAGRRSLESGGCADCQRGRYTSSESEAQSFVCMFCGRLFLTLGEIVPYFRGVIF